jgi:hypothetical protein
LWSAKKAGATNFVVVSHNFEMLKPGRTTPSWIVVRRFEQLCEYLAEHRVELPVGLYPASQSLLTSKLSTKLPSVKISSTMRRHVEQLLCRIG